MSSFKIIILILTTPILFISSCNSEQIKFDSNSNKNFLYFDAVEKQISIDNSFPNRLNKKLTNFFEKNIKTNGIDGIANFKFKNFIKEEVLFNNGKKIIINFNLTIEIVNNSNLKKKNLNYDLKEYGQIEGSFSLNDFENLVNNVEDNIILRLIDNLN